MLLQPCCVSKLFPELNITWLMVHPAHILRFLGAFGLITETGANEYAANHKTKLLTNPNAGRLFQHW